jgi:hypothetical protein
LSCLIALNRGVQCLSSNVGHSTYNTRREPTDVAGRQSHLTPISELDESDLVASADDEFLCSEALALWALIRKARALAGQGYHGRDLRAGSNRRWR